MGISKVIVETDFCRPARPTVVREKDVRQQQHAATTAQLNNALAREKALQRENSDLLQRQDVMAQEFEHRLLNSLQLVVSLLWLQSRIVSRGVV
jgi:two-component sensor histidine kinase